MAERFRYAIIANYVDIVIAVLIYLIPQGILMSPVLASSAYDNL